jgi:hypothetical protein
MNPTCKGERIALVFVSVLFLGGLLFLIVWFPSWGSISYALLAVVMLTISFFRSRGVDETETMRRLDQAMGKGKDDPNEMARFVP